jgi:hypothetical protein
MLNFKSKIDKKQIRKGGIFSNEGGNFLIIFNHLVQLSVNECVIYTRNRI